MQPLKILVFVPCKVIQKLQFTSGGCKMIVFFWDENFLTQLCIAVEEINLIVIWDFYSTYFVFGL